MILTQLILTIATLCAAVTAAVLTAMAVKRLGATMPPVAADESLPSDGLPLSDAKLQAGIVNLMAYTGTHQKEDLK